MLSLLLLLCVTDNGSKMSSTEMSRHVWNWARECFEQIFLKLKTTQLLPIKLNKAAYVCSNAFWMLPMSRACRAIGNRRTNVVRNIFMRIFFFACHTNVYFMRAESNWKFCNFHMNKALYFNVITYTLHGRMGVFMLRNNWNVLQFAFIRFHFLRSIFHVNISIDI